MLTRELLNFVPNRIQNEVLLRALVPVARLRSLSFALQYLSYDKLFSKIPGGKGIVRRKDLKLLQHLRLELEQLLERDAHLFREGIFPLKNVWSTRPFYTPVELLDILIDGIRIYRRRAQKNHSDIPESELTGYPEYYRRNFHFQTDGYFSESSAKRYDRQVDLLFSGATDAMRRSWVRSLLLQKKWKAHFKAKGRGLRLLDVGCGPGTSTQILTDLFPEAEIVALDLSSSYLKFAEKKWNEIYGSGGPIPPQWVQGDAETFKDKFGKFDLILSIFLMHELPRQNRLAIFKNLKGLLQDQGSLVIVDAVQSGDSQHLDPFLKDFPANYHEPFFMDYASLSIRKIMEDLGLTVESEGLAFVSKYTVGSLIES